MLTEDELKAIDDWRFTARMPTRAAAVRELFKRGLAAEGFAAACWRKVAGLRRRRCEVGRGLGLTAPVSRPGTP